MKLMHLIILCGLLFLCFAVTDAAFGANVCLECHERSSFNNKVVHEPVAKGNCITCHNPHAAKHAGLLQKEVSLLCFSCHGDKERSFNKGIVHEPVKRGECTACHDPHSSVSRGLMKGQYADSCFSCHESLARKFKYMHEPYAKGQCKACHSPHQAENYQLLNMPATKLCRNCHSDSDIASVHRNYPAAIKGCLTCHNPHGSDNKGIIRSVRHEPYLKDCGTCHDRTSGKMTQETCLDCHGEIKESLLTTHNHLTDSGRNSCINCHSPHAGDTKQLLKDRPLLLCRSCHEDTYRRHEENIYVHTATANECYRCHAVHGSNQTAMLKGDGNSICLACHPDQGQFSHPVGKGVIDPRNNQEATCLSCHNPHGTDFKGQLVLSGQQELCVQCHHM